MPSESEVYEEALALFKQRGGFTTMAYFLARNTHLHAALNPGEKVVSACAIGGVEQAVWKLTGKTVPYPVRYVVAKRNLPTTSHAEHLVLYTQAMLRLNRIAREMYPVLEGDPIDNVEDVTLRGSHRTARERTLRVFRKALEEVAG